MLRVAIKMLVGDRTKYIGLLFGITFTSFLITFAASYFSGFMTRGFALISDNPQASVWVMDPAVESADKTINIPQSALYRVRSVEGVAFAVPLALGSADVKFPNGRSQPVQIIGVDDATLAGLPALEAGLSPEVLRAPRAVIVAGGGTSGKLDTPQLEADQWPYGQPHLDVPTRLLSKGDELQVNDVRILVEGWAQAMPRFPPRPLVYTTYSNAARILLAERNRLTFVMATAAPGISPRKLADRIQARTGLRARASDEFKADTVWWFLTNSEDVGDIASMLTLAITVGFGVTGIMLYMFTAENLRQYAVLNVMGAPARMLIGMIFAQAGLCAVMGTGLGLGLCGIVGQMVSNGEYPFRMMWFTPLRGVITVVLVSLVAAAISARPLLRLQATTVFAGR
jgi:putative ABC transport system permease protein